MKRKIVLGFLSLTLAASLLAGCAKKTPGPEDSSEAKAGTLTLLNSTEEDYARFQNQSLKYIIGIEAGEEPAEISGLDEAGNNPGEKSPQYVYYDNLTSMVMGLNSGEIQEIQLYSSIGRYICSSNTSLQVRDLYEEATKEETKEAIEKIYSDGFSFMLSEEKKELRDELDKAIVEMKNDGTLEKLEREHIEDVIAGKEPVTIAMDEFPGAETVRVAVTGDLPPLDYISPDGTPGGFNTAVLAEVGRRIGKNIELVNIDSGARAISLSSGNVDVVFWTRNSVEGLPPEGTPGENPDGAGPEEGAVSEGEDPMSMIHASEEPPELPPEDGMGKAFEEYKKRDMPEGTIVTIPYFTDHYVMVTKK